MAKEIFAPGISENHRRQNVPWSTYICTFIQNTRRDNMDMCSCFLRIVLSHLPNQILQLFYLKRHDKQ